MQHVSSSRFLLVQVAERHVALAPPEQCRVTQAADGDVLVPEQSLTLPFPRHHHPTAARLRGAPSDAQSGSAAAAGGGAQPSGGPATFHRRQAAPLSAGEALQISRGMESTHRSAGARELSMILMQPIGVADARVDARQSERRGLFEGAMRGGSFPYKSLLSCLFGARRCSQLAQHQHHRQTGKMLQQPPTSAQS